ncbi:hypothetical protein [Bradyrhizobium sp.]|jgi:hypothetical protein|uniref:hypothetical protein n=1 Tax=Bradyrhizobium sp. TaxID=376 RepID=UPI003C7ECEB3
MSRRTIVSVAATVIVGIACMATVSTDAFAAKKTAARAAVQPTAAPPVVAPVAVAVGNGAIAEGIPRCFDSVLLYPYPPCY